MKKLFPFIVLITGISLLAFTFTNCGRSSRRFVTSVKSDLDKQLDLIIAANDLVPLESPSAESPQLVALGKELFFDTSMSGLNDVSCASCHSPNLGSGDGLPLSLGSGTTGTFPNRRQVAGVLPMRRHSMALFNTGRDGRTHALWDGRLNLINGVPSTPLAILSGPNPQRSDITSMFENAFDIQPLFPIINRTEFLGVNNPLANLGNPSVIWDTVLFQRLLTQTKYVTLFSQAYPNVATNNLNPGHISRAIRAYTRTTFVANNSPFDKYIAGDIHALTENQKLGMRTFYTNGACNVCHTGNTFTNNDFEGIAVPQLTFAPFQDDRGREDDTGNPADRYHFKTPGLRNVKLSAPYMHNGAFDTLESVISHYSNVESSINNYTIPPSFQQHYELTLIFDNDSARNQERIDQVSDPRLKAGINLRPEEQQNLVDFLENGLLDETFKNR